MSNSAYHEEILEQKQEEVINKLQLWAKKEGLIKKNEELVVDITMNIETVAPSEDVDPAEKLPSEKPVKGLSKLRKSFLLNQQDWEDILHIECSGPESLILKWLHENNNGPLARKDFVAVCGEKSGASLTRRVNSVLDKASNYQVGVKRRYFKFKLVRPSGPYAIQKFGFF